MTPLEPILFLAGHFLSIIGVIFALIFLSRAQADSFHPSATMAWLLGMVFLPYITIPLYLLVGGRKMRKMAKRKPRLAVRDPGPPGEADELSQWARMLSVEGVPPATGGNRVEMLPGPVETWQRFMELIEEARESIHITTFILSRDDVARQVVEALARKAREGVRVRLLLDAVGSFRTRGAFCNPIREAGGQVGVFLPVLPLRRKWSANLRNHRKIVIADEKIAMIGGRNIGAQYMAPEPREGQWSDFAMILEGPSVQALGEIFAADWEFATDEPVPDVIKHPDETLEHRPGNRVVQVVASGPDIEGDPFYELVLGAMFQARRRVWLVTPYFVPGETILRTLKVLAQIGRDVRLITPEKSDRVLVNMARRYFLRELTRAGGKVYMHHGPLLHTKLMIIDDDICAVGSPNIDMRSLYLNYEVAAFLYSGEETARLEAHVEELMRDSRHFHARKRGAEGVVMETMENLSLILSPLL